MDARVKPAHDARVCRAFTMHPPLTDSIFKQPTLRPPYSLRRGTRCLPVSRPSQNRGDGAPSGAPVFRLAAFPFGERGRLSALHRGDFCSPGPRFLGRGHCRPVPSPAGSLRSGRNAARSGPGASPVRGCEPRARAPHPLPPAMTPHESALGGGDKGDYNPIGINVKGRSPQPYPPSS